MVHASCAFPLDVPSSRRTWRPRRLLLALTLAAEPAVSWRPEGDAREHDVIFPSVIPSAQLMQPLGSIVDAMRRARVHPSCVNAFLADPDPSAAVQLCAAAGRGVVHRHLAEPSDDDAGLSWSAARA